MTRFGQTCSAACSKAYCPMPYRCSESADAFTYGP
jgi:hypothetical protein